MDDLGDRIQEVLGDPAQMAQIMDLARSLMGGEGEAPETPASPAAGGMAEKLGALLGRESGQNEQQALLRAMRPYLSEKRQRKMDRAMRLARMAHLAKLALEGMEAADDA